MTRRNLLALAATGAFGAERLNRAPISHETLKLNLPQAEPVKLSNGVTVLAMEDNRLPIATVLFQIEGAGSIYSPKPGVAELTAEMLTEGAGARSGKQIGDEAARLGALIAASAPSAAETVTVDGSGLTSRFDEWLDLLTSVVLHPTFPADEFAGVKQRRIVQARVRSTSVTPLAVDTAQRALFGSHPAAVTSPPAEALARLTTDALAAWHRERYTPAKAVIGCIGRIKPAAVVSKLEKLLSGWNTPSVNATLPPNPPPLSTRRVVLVDRPGAAQTELVIGNLIFDRRDPDWFPLSIASVILGGSLSSRLTHILRYEKHYVLNVQNIYTATRFSGFHHVRTTARTDATIDSVSIILEQLKRICDEPVPAAELDAGKRAVVGNFALNLERPGTILNQSYLRYRYGFSLDYWDRYPAKMMAVTSAETQAVAQKYMDPNRVLIVAVGDASKIRSGLEKFAKVEMA
jgi:zinc protease